MSFRPHLDIVQLSARVPRGRDGIWSVIRDLDAKGPWTINDVSARTNVHGANVSSYVARLRRGGFAEQVGEEGSHRHVRKVYRLTRSPMAAPRLAYDGSRLPETGNETLWRTMKMLKVFGASELAAHCPGVSLVRTRTFVTHLAQAGVLAIARKRRPDAEAQYRVAINIGSRAPMILHAKIVFDPNANQVIGQPETREVAP